MNVFFAGTPECAIPALQAIAKVYPLAGVLTAPPARAGRGKKYADAAIAQAVVELKERGVIAQEVPVFTPEKLNTDFREAVAALRPDIMVCFAYGKIFGPKTLALFPQVRSIFIRPCCPDGGGRVRYPQQSLQEIA